MQRLIGINKSVLSELASDGVIVRGDRRGTYKLEASVASYCNHLRSMAAGRGGEDAAVARARLGLAQATLAETKAKALAGELVEASEVEALWTSKMRSFRARILGIGDRMRELPALQRVKLVTELRGALTELADG